MTAKKMDANAWVARGRRKGQSRKELRAKVKRAMKKAPKADRGLLVASSVPWPKLDRPGPAYIGLVEDVVSEITPKSEADPAALALTFIAQFGNALGPEPYIQVEGNRHPGRLNVLLVGRTARARKGTAQTQTFRVMEQTDGHWADRHQVRSLSTGEGLARLIKDRAKRCNGDQRILVTAAEFSAILRIATRQGNPLSEIMRQAWDDGSIHIPTRKAPIFIDGAHVSVIGHITVEELRARMTDTDLVNGFANRFLFACVERSKKLPRAPLPDYEGLGDKIRERLAGARDLGQLRWTKRSYTLWKRIYLALPDRRGAVGKVAARAEAQMLRLAVIYAALDLSRRIREEHILAAQAVWQYAEGGARYIFGDQTGKAVADKLLAFLRAVHPEWVSHSDQRDAFDRNISAPVLEDARQTLMELGLIEQRQVKTRGRPKWEHKAVME